MQAPGLAVVLVGSRTDSATYVRMKKKACAEAGILDFGRDLPGDATQEQIVATVQELNNDPRVDGILVQVSCTPARRTFPEFHRIVHS